MERIYTINLRREFQKAPNYKKASKSIRALKEFLKKHMKTDEIIIGKYLNQEIWKNGPKNPPAKVNVKVVKEDNKAKVELVGAPEEVKQEPKKKKSKNLKEKLEEAVKSKPGQGKKEEKAVKEIKNKIPKAHELKEAKEWARKG